MLFRSNKDHPMNYFCADISAYVVLGVVFVVTFWVSSVVGCVVRLYVVVSIFSGLFGVVFVVTFWAPFGCHPWLHV